MAEVLEPLERLTDMFRRLDGVGKKSAARYAFCVLNFSDEEAAEFARAILADRPILILDRAPLVEVRQMCEIFA